MTTMNTARALGRTSANAGAIEEFTALPMSIGGTGLVGTNVTASSRLPYITNAATNVFATANGVANGAVYWGTSAGSAPIIGTLPVASGGTGRNTLTANALLVGNGTTAINQQATMSTSTNGQFLTNNGTTASWANAPGAIQEVNTTAVILDNYVNTGEFIFTNIQTRTNFPSGVFWNVAYLRVVRIVSVNGDVAVRQEIFGTIGTGLGSQSIATMYVRAYYTQPTCNPPEWTAWTAK